MMTIEEITQTKSRIEKIEKLIQYWRGHQSDAEMRALVYSYEVDRLTDELAAYRTMLQMYGLEDKINEVTGAVKSIVTSATQAQASVDDPDPRLPLHQGARAEDRRGARGD